MLSVSRLVKQCRRYCRSRKKLRYDSFGQYASCGHAAFFMDDIERREGMIALAAGWGVSGSSKNAYTERENSFCMNCYANYRVRAHAQTVLSLLGLAHVGDLARRFRTDDSFRFYETATYNIFRARQLKYLPGYVVSEYFDDVPPGTFRNGIRCENLERLTFPDEYFDVVVNSDVLEHVHELERVHREIHRVLKPGGYHVFTVPVDNDLPRTRDRVRFLDGKPEQILPVILHGDTIREEGSPVIRDFGRDILEYMNRGKLQYQERQARRAGLHIASVFFAQKG